MWLPLMLLVAVSGAATLAIEIYPGLIGGARESIIVDQRFQLCGFSQRGNCVIDGDTIRHDGVKIRIADIDTPEISEPKCPSEAALGHRAKERLLALLNAGPFEIVSGGSRDLDIHGRKLRILMRDGQSLGDILIAQGLARRWDGARRSWCR